MLKLWLMLGTLAAGAATATTNAAAQDEAAFRTAMMARCATIGDKAARLACYEAAQRDGPIAMPPPSNGSSPVASAAPTSVPPARASGEKFGRATPRARVASGSESQIKARAVAATDDGRGYWTIRLDNGASWKLVEFDQMFRPPSRNQAIRIRKGALGGYLMDVDHQPAVRVERVD